MISKDIILDLCILPDDKKVELTSILEKAETASGKIELRILAQRAFDCIDPQLNMDLLFSSTKNFAGLNYTKEQALNGIHIIRSHFAHLINKMRRKVNGYKTRYAVEFDNRGIVVINNFLDSKLQSDVIEEIKKFPLATAKNNINIITYLSDEYKLKNVLNNSDMKRIVFDCLGIDADHPEANSLYLNNTYVQRLHNVVSDGDVQKITHSDTFFPCVKWWYFPEEVKETGGPFTYVPRSHVFEGNRINFEFIQSCNIVEGKIDSSRTYSHIEGSFRVFDNELADMNLKAITYPVLANTLVVANVRGFHRRAEVVTEARRNAIHGSIRTNRPFD